MYLNNLEEAVISKSGEGLRYFNSKGINLINKCVNTKLSKVMVDQQTNYLAQMEKEMDSKFQNDGQEFRDYQFEDRILQTKIFTEYVHSKHDDLSSN